MSELFISKVECPRCGVLVGVQWVFSAVFSVTIFIVTLITTVMVLSQMDIYAALIWFSFPIGSLTYIKVRFCPLEAKKPRFQPRDGSAT
jgi:hypothetical protein